MSDINTGPAAAEDPVASPLANRFADMSAFEIATMVIRDRAEAQHVRQQADERLAALDRANAQITELKAELRRAQNDANDREREARLAREATDLARQAAAELRGRLKEVRANQMVRRGDLVGFGEVRPPNFDPYDDGVPF